MTPAACGRRPRQRSRAIDSGPMTRRDKGRTLAADQLPALPLRPGAGTLRVLMIGDVIGKPGRVALERHPARRCARSAASTS